MVQRIFERDYMEKTSSWNNIAVLFTSFPIWYIQHAFILLFQDLSDSRIFNFQQLSVYGTFVYTPGVLGLQTKKDHKITPDCLLDAPKGI